MSDVSLGLVHEVEVMLRKVGATRENFWKPLSKNEGLARRVVKLVNDRPTYDVVVNYNRSLAEMVNVGQYDWVNANINKKNFPIVGEGEHKVSVTLFHFNRYIESEEVVTEMEKEGYRHAKIEELLALGETRPDLQREFPIIALGSSWSIWWNPRGGRFIPALWVCAGGRYLRLAWFEDEWSSDCRFLAVHT